MQKQLITYFITTTLLLFSGLVSAQIKVGAIYDITGPLSAYGDRQIKALNLAIENINANGGVLGQKVQVVSYDTLSNLENYEKYASEAVQRKDLAAVFAGLTSSSREVVRPVIRKANMPYFYSTLYEGGACDKQTFVTGSSASQQLEPLLKWAVKKYGTNIYIMAPDYNFGHISAHWVHEYSKQYGAKVLGEDFIDLSVTDYSDIIEKIKKLNPDFVVGLPVGPNQMNFIKEFTNAGLKEKIGIVSTTYGGVGENIDLEPEFSEGVVGSQAYFIGINTPENKKFLEMWEARYGDITYITIEVVTLWNAVHLWAKAVNIVGNTKPNAVIAALESGMTFKGPNGRVALDPRSHHLRQNMYIAKIDNNRTFKIVKRFKDVDASFESEQCNLVANPKLVEHFTPDFQK